MHQSSFWNVSKFGNLEIFCQFFEYEKELFFHYYLVLPLCATAESLPLIGVESCLVVA